MASSTTFSSSNCNVQRARPAGGELQARVINRASFQGFARRKIFLCLRQPPNSPQAARGAAARDGAAPPWPRRQAGQQLVEEGFESILTRNNETRKSTARPVTGTEERGHRNRPHPLSA